MVNSDPLLYRLPFVSADKIEYYSNRFMSRTKFNQTVEELVDEVYSLDSTVADFIEEVVSRDECPDAGNYFGAITYLSIYESGAKFPVQGSIAAKVTRKSFLKNTYNIDQVYLFRVINSMKISQSPIYNFLYPEDVFDNVASNAIGVMVYDLMLR